MWYHRKSCEVVYISSHCRRDWKRKKNGQKKNSAFQIEKSNANGVNYGQDNIGTIGL